jgi:hypothetical protein
MKNLIKINKMKNLRKMYNGKEVNPKFYEIIKVGGIATEPHELTKEEFRQGKQGIVWMDNKTGNLVFKK